MITITTYFTTVSFYIVNDPDKNSNRMSLESHYYIWKKEHIELYDLSALCLTKRQDGQEWNTFHYNYTTL